MPRARTHKTVTALVAGVVCLVAPDAAKAVSPAKLSGAITGVVTDSIGIPQMGATVLLFNRQDRLYEKVLTDERGEFRFLGLFPDLYSVRITLSTYVPAFKRDILVQSGIRRYLNVNLNSLISSIQLVYPPPGQAGMMSDDWKWVLRSASATRPVLRFVDQPVAHTKADTPRGAVFSDTRGILRLSAGDGPQATSVANEADLGTAFALATSLYGNNMLQVSGNLGYGAQTGVPAAAFRTAYTRGTDGPQVSVTMRQLFASGRMNAAVAPADATMAVLRSVSAGFDDRTEITDQLSLRYGFSMDSVSFLDHLNYFSPYARLTYSLGDGSAVDFSYTSGNARPDLGTSAEQDTDLQRDISTLGLFPRISMRGGRPRIQRGEDYELAYTRKVGSRTYYVSVYRESVSDAALSLVAPAGMFASSDILPDLFSGNSIFNAGNYASSGYTAAVTQNMGDNLSATFMYGSMGALTADDREVVSESPDDLRSMIRAGRRHAATARVSATSPWTGTRVIASYQWTGAGRWAMPGHIYGTQSFRQMPGLNVYIRQPIPGLSVLPWRMEATADLRNMLAQGYLPVGMVDGQRLLLVQTPRCFRGGLSFIF
ncbi:MAG TPA: carboxypeptidase-like regulatory domain-containing protein [Bryobacteraceae bacterium]|nr:carboxypeptidase-like regulatory domain-containing protein [Bryobacteraceae bacterium]